MAQSRSVSGQPSDEANEKQLKLAKEQGDAFGKAVKEMTTDEAHGQEKRVGDYVIGVANEHAEGMYTPVDGKLEWQEPQDENTHIEVVVRDAADGRFIPGLRVTATVIDANGREIGTHEQPFLWHSWLYHYGRNWQIPGEGEYTVKVHVDRPNFHRHDKKNGNRFAEPADVEFANIKLVAGRKRS